jgi:septum formation protein
MNIILASASPRRAALLKQINLRFTIEPSTVDENSPDATSPANLVMSLSQKKGRDVAGRNSNSIIIAADTVVCLNNQILGKPGNHQEAAHMLQSLSGEKHDVYSGVYVAKTDNISNIVNDFSFIERTKVTFSALTEREIEMYIKSGSPFDKAGGYGIQDDLGSLFVKKIEGDYYNVVGFPLNGFYQQLKQHMPQVHQQLFF